MIQGDRTELHEAAREEHHDGVGVDLAVAERTREARTGNAHDVEGDTRSTRLRCARCGRVIDEVVRDDAGLLHLRDQWDG